MGNLASVTDPNGVVETYTYDAKNRLTNLAAVGGSGANATNLSYAYTLDNAGQRTSVTEASGNVTDTYDYDAFGNLIHSATTLTSPTPNEFLFAGEQYDTETGHYYNRARYLNTSTGRFMTMDAFDGDPESPLSIHKYLYTEADPVNGTDPSGNQDDIAAEGASETLDSMSALNLMLRVVVESARIEVHFDLLATFHYHHAYLVVSGAGGPPLVFRGGPSKSGCGLGAASKDASDSVEANDNLGCGYLTDAGSGETYEAGHADYPKYPTDNVAIVSVTNVSASYSQVTSSFRQSAQHIERLHLYYHPVSQNSNSFAHTLLLKAHLIPPTPPVWVPGWDHILY